jgi:hypothetical protein
VTRCQKGYNRVCAESLRESCENKSLPRSNNFEGLLVARGFGASAFTWTLQ